MDRRYDNSHNPIQGDEFQQRGFRSTRQNRFVFKKQDKADFQDDEDIEHEMEEMKLLSDFKDLCGALDLVISELQVSSTDEVKPLPVKRRKVKVRLDYGDDNGEGDDIAMKELDRKLLKVNSKMKLQKGQVVKDPIYTDFIKDMTPLQPVKHSIPLPPPNYKSSFKTKDIKNAPLTKHTASTLLKSKFIPSGRSSPVTEQQIKSGRITLPIEIDPLVLKRLNITR